MTPPTKITVLISGNGTNLQALIDDREKKLPTSKINRVISNRKAAYGLTRAQNANIPTTYHNLLAYKKKFPTSEGAPDVAREEYDKDLAALIIKDEPNVVVCAGFMHILSPGFLEPLEGKGISIINLHPALPGQYTGAGAIEKAHKDFMDGKITQTGVMIHYVITDVDMGDALLEVPIPLTHPEDDDISALEDKIHRIEHGAIVEGTRLAVEAYWRKRAQ